MRKLVQMYPKYNTKKFEATFSILNERRCLISGYYSCPTMKGHFNRNFSTVYVEPCYFFITPCMCRYHLKLLGM